VLPADDARAGRSRRDLRLLNRIMGHVRILTAQLRRAGSFSQKTQRSLLEVGAGDGWVMSQVARQLGQTWAGTRLVLMDKQPPTPSPLRDFVDAGWLTQITAADVLNFQFLDETTWFCATIANLFLHHFSDAELRQLLPVLAAKTNCFIALEPRRSPLALLGSRCVGLMGCNSVTQHDAPASVRAGFCDHEISRCWPQTNGWQTQEWSIGLFSHIFVARRVDFK